MKKNKIFSKLNIKNYTNELEEVLEKKMFSLDVKNLLLSMVYKIQNAYKDYMAVKVEVLPQKDMISYIIGIIRDDCNDIDFISPEDGKIYIDKGKGKIRCHPNEKALLSSIWYMGEIEADVDVKYEYTKEAIQKMIEIGNNCNQTEILRDFNGWSWDIVKNEIEHIEYNILYQSLLLIGGKDIVYANIDTERKERISLYKTKKSSDVFLDTLINCSFNIYKSDNPDKLDELKRIQNDKINELELINNKKEFIQNITNKKKECLSKIEQIDRIINNKELLRKEYEKRNELLPNKEKIFSISHLVGRLEDERKGLLGEIQRCNKIIDPKEFVKEKERIQEEVDFLNDNKSIIDCCKACLRCVKEYISKVEEKTEIINWIYKVRYYGYIPYNEKKNLKDLKELKKAFKDIIQLLIRKAQEYKVMDIFTENEELAYIVIKELLNSKMINFENVNIICDYKDRNLYIEYYDDNILEKKYEYKVENVRIKKRIKLFQ